MGVFSERTVRRKLAIGFTRFKTCMYDVLVKRILVIMLVCFVTTLRAEARLGETREECLARYGNPKRTYGDSLIYEKSGFIIHCFFVKNKCELMYIQSPNPMSDELIMGFLDKNRSGQGDWLKVYTMNNKSKSVLYQECEDGKSFCTAIYRTGKEVYELEITTKYGSDNKKEIESTADKKAVENSGF